MKLDGSDGHSGSRHLPFLDDRSEMSILTAFRVECNPSDKSQQS